MTYESNTILYQYPKLEISTELKNELEKLKTHKFIANSRVLHIKGGKINHLSIYLILKTIDEDTFLKKIKLLNGELPYRIITARSFYKLIENI